MRLEAIFTKRTQGRGPVADASIYFGTDAGPLTVFEITGCAIWQGDKGLYASVPSREYEQGGVKKRFDYIQRRKTPQNDDINVYQLKNWLVDEYKRQNGAQADGDAGEDVPW